MSAVDLGQFTRDPVSFIDRFIPRNEKGRPWSLSRYQRRVLAVAFQWGPAGALLFRILLWSEVKKSGKTFLAACLVIWWAYTRGQTEVIIAANDLEQSIGRVFRTITALLRFNPELAQSATVRTAEIILSNATTILAIPSDYKGAAGSRHSLVVFDELWGYMQESAQRLYEELTPPPTEPDAWILIVSSAGWTGESVLLEELYRRGLAGERLDEDLEIYRTAELVMFWSHTPRQPWLTSEYYAEQQRILRRPGTFNRLHRNEWTSGRGGLWTLEQWDACTDPNHRPLLPTKAVPLYVGVDASTKRDRTAVVGVTRDGDRVRLAFARFWQPSRTDPMDFEETVERTLLEIHNGYALHVVRYDPHQFHGSATRLRKRGLPMEEYEQTIPKLEDMAQSLFDAVKFRTLVLYQDLALREEAAAALAVETRNEKFYISKVKSSQKIDQVVGLALAVRAAVDHASRPEPQMTPLGVGARRGEPLPGDAVVELMTPGQLYDRIFHDL